MSSFVKELQSQYAKSAKSKFRLFFIVIRELYLRIEIRKLKRKLGAARQLHTLPIMSMDHSYSYTNQPRVVWELKTITGLSVYVCLRNTALIGCQKHVIFVDSQRFYLAWLNSTIAAPLTNRPVDSCVLRSEMISDYKYNSAAKGFQDGKSNPVPLTQVGVEIESKNLRIRFSDTITRTFWLISNQVQCFPVLVRSSEEANLLFEVAGIGIPPSPVSHFFATNESEVGRETAKK